MDRFMLHLKHSEYSPQNAPVLLRRARELCSETEALIRDMRVSSKTLEFDVSVDKTQLENILTKLQPIGILDNAKHVIEESFSKEEALKKGIFYFNEERFWECHEVLEGVWKNCYEGEKDLVQGIILVAAALVHYQKNEDRICLSIMGRAMDKLANSSGEYFQINIDKLRKKISEIKQSGIISTFEI